MSECGWVAVARRDLQDWASYGGRGDVESAILDYSQLLLRNKSCEVRIPALS